MAPAWQTNRPLMPLSGSVMPMSVEPSPYSFWCASVSVHCKTVGCGEPARHVDRAWFHARSHSTRGTAETLTSALLTRT